MNRSFLRAWSRAVGAVAALLVVNMANAADVPASTTPAAAAAGAATAATNTACPSLLNHRFTSLQGAPQDLCQYTGRVVLVVNTASYCGYTPQYEGLQALQDKYGKQGFVVLGFPANDFGAQEPGSNAEVADFCERTYKVKFPMFAKSSVLEGQANPLHEQLFKITGQRPKWNFHKYLIGRDGKTVSSYTSKIAPGAPELVSAIEQQIAVK